MNPVNLPASQQFEELSDEEKMKDPVLKSILQYLDNLHKEEMKGYKLQCISRGVIDAEVTEYHVTWTTSGVQYRAYVKSFNGALQETSFGELETISLDHYRLDEFEKMFIMNFQKLDDKQLKTDTNFMLAYQSLLDSVTKLKFASLIGVAQKPMGLGYIYHIFMRDEHGVIIRAEVYLELYSMQASVKNVVNEDFNTGMISLSQQDKSTQKIVSVIQKQAKAPALKEGGYTVNDVHGKDFLFGKMFKVGVSQEGKNFEAMVYHDQSSEEVLMLNWGVKGDPAGCAAIDDMSECIHCIEGYTKINGVCVFGCGVLCKSVEF